MTGPDDTRVRFSPSTEAAASEREDGTEPAEAHDARYAAVRADVEARLRRACAGMPSELFDELVSNICSRKLRWAREEEDDPMS